MPFVGSGNLELERLTPGAQRPFDILNADLAQIDAENPWIQKFTFSVTFAVGDFVAVGLNGNVYLAQADRSLPGTNGYLFNCLGKSLNAGVAGDVGRVHINGLMVYTTASLFIGAGTTTVLPGAPVYLSATPGKIQSGAPNIVGVQNKIIGVFQAGQTLLFRPTVYAAN